MRSAYHHGTHSRIAGLNPPQGNDRGDQRFDHGGKSPYHQISLAARYRKNVPLQGRRSQTAGWSTKTGNCLTEIGSKCTR